MKILKRMLPYLMLLLIFIIVGCEAKEPHSRSTRMETVSLQEMNYEDIFNENINKGRPMQSGLFQLEKKNKNKGGWKTVMSITVKDEKITECSYDEVDEKGNMKTTDTDYLGNNLKNQNLRPMIFIPKLNNLLIDKQNPEKITNFQGNDITLNKFKRYAKLLINSSVEGNHSIPIIEN